MPRIFNKFTEGLLTDQLVFVVRQVFMQDAAKLRLPTVI